MHLISPSGQQSDSCHNNPTSPLPSLQLDCCGPNGFQDWINNSTGDFGEDALFPLSCCVPAANGTVPSCNMANATSTENVYSSGCIMELTDFVREQLLIVAAIGIAFVVAEVSGRVEF